MTHGSTVMLLVAAILSEIASVSVPGEGPHYSVNGAWGNVLGNREALPLGSAWEERDDLKSVQQFVEAAVNERWGGCRECSHAGRLQLREIRAATRQIMSFTKDGTHPLTMEFRLWNGEVANEPLLLGTIYNMTVEFHALDADHATEDGAVAAAYRETVHDIVMYGDREGLFSVVQHTWNYPAELSALPPSLASPHLLGLPSGLDAAAPLSLVCYNIWNFNAPWPQRVDLITKQINQRSPDIIAFQEVRYDNAGPQLGPEGTRHQVDHLLWRLETAGIWQVVWVPAMSYLQDDKGLAIQTEGPSIFTRLPVKHVDALQLTRMWPEDKGDEHQRVALAVTIETKQLGAVNVLTTHLTLSETARMNNVYEICKYAKGLEGDPRRGNLTILTGDLNMIPSDGAMQYLLGEKEYRGTRCDFRDLWLDPNIKRIHELGEDHLADGFTFTNLNQKLQKRIDFVLVRGAGAEDASFDLLEVFGSRAKARGQVPPSDHMGLYLKMSARGAQNQACGSDPSAQCNTQEEL